MMPPPFNSVSSVTLVNAADVYDPLWSEVVLQQSGFNRFIVLFDLNLLVFLDLGVFSKKICPVLSGRF